MKSNVNPDPHPQAISEQLGEAIIASYCPTCVERLEKIADWAMGSMGDIFYDPSPDPDMEESDPEPIAHRAVMLAMLFALERWGVRDLVEACEALLKLIDGQPWHTRDAIYRQHNERVGDLPGSLPSPIVIARAAIAKAKHGEDSEPYSSPSC